MSSDMKVMLKAYSILQQTVQKAIDRLYDDDVDNLVEDLENGLMKADNVLHGD